MSFAAEMRDFFSGFKATSSAAGDIRDRIDKRKNTFDFDSAKKSAPGAGTFGPGAGGSKTSGKGSVAPPADIKKVIDTNVPEEMRPYAYRMAQKESAFNPSAVSKTGATGLFQFTSGTWTDMTKQSIGAHTDGRKDPVANTQAFVKLTERNKGYLTKVLGREPTFGELAIAHQQGPAGAAYLITGRAPKGMNVAQIDKNLAHNNVKAKGIDAAKHIAGYYGFDLGDMSTVAQGAIPDVPVAEYTPPQVDGGSYADVNPDIRGERTVSQYGSDESSGDQADLLEGSRNAGIDIAALDVPEGAKLYSPGDLTQTASTMYGAEGGAVPWGNETSYQAKQAPVTSTWRPKQSYGPLQAVPAVADDPTAPKKARPPRTPYDTQRQQDALNETYANMRMGSYGGKQEWHGYGGPTEPPASSSKNSEFLHRGFSPLQYRRTGYITGKNGDLNQDGVYTKLSQPVDRNKVFGFAKKAVSAPIGGKKMFAAGGAVDNEPVEEAAVHTEETPAPAAAIPTAPAPAPSAPVTPAGNPRGANRDVLAMDERPRPNSGDGGMSFGNVIDLGLKHLTRSLGLDKNGSAVGPDPELKNRQRKLVNGAIAPNEGPPNSEEAQQIFQTVDPNGELDEGLRTIYAMRKGVEFYLQRGDVDKAGKFAAGLIQYSNLLSRQYGYEAVQAGKKGDEEGMVRYAIKAYDAVPDARTVDAQKVDGGYQVTRKDEDGNVVDQHMLTPQQIFQMATGITTGSGYFEALMEVAEPGTAASKAKERQGKARAGNLDKLLPDIKGDMDPGEIEAWSSAVEDGDYDTLNKIMGNVQTRRRERLTQENYDKRQEDIDRRLEEGRAAAEANLDKRLTASEERQQRAIDAADERSTKRDETREAADLKKRERRVKGKVKLRSDYEPDMTASEKEQWDAAVEEVDPEALDDIMKNVDKRRDNKRSDERTANQNKAIDDRQTRSQEATDQRAEKNRTAQETRDLEKRKRRAGTLNEMFDAYSPNMSASQKRAWKKAFEDADPETMQTIINSLEGTYGAPDPAQDGEGEGAIPTAPQAPALTSSAEAAPVTSGGNPIPADVLAKARKALAEGRSRAGVIKKLEDAGYSTEGL